MIPSWNTKSSSSRNIACGLATGATGHCGGTPHSCGSGPAQFNVLPDKSGVPAETMQPGLSQCQGAPVGGFRVLFELAGNRVTVYRIVNRRDAYR
jgi:hypothetical protein